MKNSKFFVAMCLCLLVASVAYAKPPAQRPTTSYHGYAALDDGSGYVVKSDGQNQYIDRELTGTGFGDRIEVEVYNDTGELKYLRCFIGKPELPWRSERRVQFNSDILTGAEGPDYATNKTVTDMLTYTVEGFNNNIRRDLTDNSIHFCAMRDYIITQTGTIVEHERVYFLVDKTCIAGDPDGDPDAITQTNLTLLDPNAPRYKTSIEFSTDGEIDPHDHIVYMLYDDQLKFDAIKSENGIPIMWEITPDIGPVMLQAFKGKAKGKAVTYDIQTLRVFNAGLPFRLIVSRDTITSIPVAPRLHKTASRTWGDIKTEYR